jgi:Zn-dependent protease with chaperone function
VIRPIRAVASVALLALAGCAGTGSGGQSTASTPAMPSWLGGKGTSVTMLSTLKPGVYEPSTLAVGEEKDLALHRAQGLGFVRSAALEQYLNETHARLIAVSGKTSVPGRVMLLASPTFDAITTPDGNVYVSLGFLESLESADEVAALLAHETSHALLKHHNSDILGDMQKKGQALYELGVGAKTALSGRSTVAKGDAKTMREVQLAGEATDKVVLPAWGRGQEREADLLGLDLLVESHLSAPAMMSMLEKLQAWEKANAESEQAFTDRLTQASQRNLNEAAGVAYQKLLSTVSVNHPKTEERIADTAQYLEKFYGTRELAEPQAAPWKAIRARPEVAQVMRNYKTAFAARRLFEQGKMQEAYTMARTALNGRQLTEAYPNWVFADAAYATGRPREGFEALRRAVSSSEPVANVYEELIVRYEQANNIPAAIQWTDNASKAFAGSPRFIPHKIRLLRKAGHTAEAESLTVSCSLNNPEFKRLCQEANQTPAGRAQR